jgi:hypothetical protein
MPKEIVIDPQLVPPFWKVMIWVTDETAHFGTWQKKGQKSTFEDRSNYKNGNVMGSDQESANFRGEPSR